MVEDICLESVWREKLLKRNWSYAISGRIEFAWASSTLKTYNGMLSKMNSFAITNGLSFPPQCTADLALLLDFIAERSSRPRSVLNTAQAALGHLYKALDMTNLCDSQDIRLLISALVKSGTTDPMNRSFIMPTDSFKTLFLSMKDNDGLSIKDLRMKTITLLALYLMLRPSDIAPHSVHTGVSIQKNLFTLRNLNFKEDSLVVTFFGIKNDLKRNGFEVTLFPHKNIKLDAISALRSYIDRTSEERSTSGSEAVFIALRKPYDPLYAAGVASVLQDAIDCAGLKGQGYSAKSFRPTGATKAISNDVDPNIVRSIGRWKSADIFFEHYVHSLPPQDYTDHML